MIVTEVKIVCVLSKIYSNSNLLWSPQTSRSLFGHLSVQWSSQKSKLFAFSVKYTQIWTFSDRRKHCTRPLAKYRTFFVRMSSFCSNYWELCTCKCECLTRAEIVRSRFIWWRKAELRADSVENAVSMSHNPPFCRRNWQLYTAKHAHLTKSLRSRIVITYSLLFVWLCCHMSAYLLCTVGRGSILKRDRVRLQDCRFRCFVLTVFMGLLYELFRSFPIIFSCEQQAQ